jgi:tetratricopeptide (TPR) repeat protein
MPTHQLLATLLCIVCLAACAAPQDAWQARYQAGQKALQQKDRQLAIKEFQSAAQVAQLELQSLPAGDPKRTPIKTRLADTLSAVAKIKIDSGDLTGAHYDLLVLLKLQEELSGHEDAATALVLSALSTVAYEQEKFAEAEGYAREAYEIRLKVLGDKHPHVAIAANNLAEVYQKQGKDAEAEEMFEQSINIYKKSDNQTGVLDVLNNLAMFYKKLGRLQDARKVVETALELEKEEGNSSPVDRAMTLNALGAINKAMYEFDDADKNYREAIDILDGQGDTPQSSSALCDALDNYGDFLLLQSEYEKAEPIFKRAIAMCEKSRGKNHSSTAGSLVDMGILYKNQGKLTEAEESLKRALDIQEKGFEVDSPVVLQTLYKLSAVYQQDRKYNQASSLYETFLPRLVKRYGEKHPYVADVLENWAAVLDDSPEHKEKVKQLLARAKKIRGSEHSSVTKHDHSKPHTPPRIVAPHEEES